MIATLYFLVLLALGVYSYSQIDLNLTLLQTSWFLSFQKSLIQLGYFHRPQSTGIFLAILSALTVFYVYFFRQSQQGKVKKKEILFILFALSTISILSYPAFSHDLFNSIFYPRLIIEHAANPYESTALMFPGDDWTRFMQWTHNTYQWGPVYLLLTIPVYLIGLGKFVLTLTFFKFFHLGFYWGCAYIINKISKYPGVVLFALNPLIIIEVVISAHLDIVMLFFSLLAILLTARKIYPLAALSWIFSVGIKFSTVLLFPVLVFWHKMSIRMRKIALLSLGLAGALIQVSFRDLLPHYFIVPLGLAALYPDDKRIVYITICLSIFFLLVRYTPFLYTGQWLSIKFF